MDLQCTVSAQIFDYPDTRSYIYCYDQDKNYCFSLSRFREDDEIEIMVRDQILARVDDLSAELIGNTLSVELDDGMAAKLDGDTRYSIALDCFDGNRTQVRAALLAIFKGKHGLRMAVDAVMERSTNAALDAAIVQALQNRLQESREFKAIVGTFIAPPAASLEAVLSSEAALGRSLPTLLRALYLEAANGGFGPGYGVMGVAGGFTDDQGMTLDTRTSAFRMTDPEDDTWSWQKTWFPFCHWGCGVYSVVDCAEPFPVFYVDPGRKEVGISMDSIIIPHKTRLSDWFLDWLSGKNLWREVFR